jgi:hypothetical protein
MRDKLPTPICRELCWKFAGNNIFKFVAFATLKCAELGAQPLYLAAQNPVGQITGTGRVRIRADMSRGGQAKAENGIGSRESIGL